MGKVTVRAMTTLKTQSLSDTPVTSPHLYHLNANRIQLTRLLGGLTEQASSMINTGHDTHPVMGTIPGLLWSKLRWETYIGAQHMAFTGTTERTPAVLDKVFHHEALLPRFAKTLWLLA